MSEFDCPPCLPSRSLLWDAKLTDTEYQLSRKFTVLFENKKFDRDGKLKDAWGAFCTIHYDLFNNGGCNLDLDHMKDHIEALGAFGGEFDLDCPKITWLEFEEQTLPPYEEEEYGFVTAVDIDAFGRRLINFIADRLGLPSTADDGYTDIQKLVFLSLKRGHVMTTSLNGTGFRNKRVLRDATESSVKVRFGNRVRAVLVESKRHGIPTRFVCLEEFVDQTIGDSTLISNNPWK